MVEERLREEAKKLLEEKTVSCLIGYERGSVPYRTAPGFFFQASEVNRLVWNPLCVYNLSKFVLEASKPVGVVVKGCDSKSLVELVKEHQIRREDVFILGIPCQGIVDPEKLEPVCDLRDFQSLRHKDDKIILQTLKETLELDNLQILLEKCLICQHHTPVIYDVLLGEAIEEKEREQYELIQELEAASLEKRLAFWAKEFERCIRCYACRNICPHCYCWQECITERLDPIWVSRAVKLPDNWMYHLIRAFHLAGRCIDCGECERVCPMRIPIRKLNKKLEKEIKDLFQYLPGINIEELPPLATFRLEDKEV